MHKERLTIIDVSQSVEHDHPHAFDFLRSDIQNTEDFFSKRGVETIGLRRAFDFITADAESTVPSMQDSAMELTTIASQADEERHASEDKDNISGEAQQTGTTGEEEDAIFAQSWIPRRLNEVVDPERDADKVAAGQANELIYSKITGVGAGQSVEKTETKPADADAVVDEASEEEGSEESSSGSDDDSDNEEDESKPRGKKHEDKDAKKVMFCEPVLSSKLNLSVLRLHRNGNRR